MRTYPTLTLTWPHPPQSIDLDLAYAALDGLSATAIEETDTGLRVFFTASADRDDAADRLRGLPDVHCEISEVSDGDWAARSQASLEPVTVGGLIVAPPWTVTPELRQRPERVIVVLPSMGFGTGHHASTRLCLRALQQIDLQGRSMLDVGTGSGVLAIAAAAMGAKRAVGIDLDPDALANARENVALNDAAGTVELHELALDSAANRLGGGFDVIAANLTGGLLCRDAGVFRGLAAPEARLIISGIQSHERAQVIGSFGDAGWRVAADAEEQDWVAVVLTPAETTV